MVEIVSHTYNLLSQPEGSPIRRLILRLGAFHIEMSFLCSIGHLMAGSGIKELFEMIYARSRRTATVQIDGVEQDDAESSDKTPCTNSDLKAAESHYDELMAMAKDVEGVADDEAIARIQAIRDGHVETLAKDPTASLWIQYLDMIRILRKFIRAERLGN